MTVTMEEKLRLNARYGRVTDHFVTDHLVMSGPLGSRLLFTDADSMFMVHVRGPTVVAYHPRRPWAKQTRGPYTLVLSEP